MDAICVYDDFSREFRPLNLENYNDDLIVGTIFFDRDAIQIIVKYMQIIGYLMIDKEGLYQPIDIRSTEIAMLEGTYNCLPLALKEELITYNLKKVPNMVWSPFFFRWQFMCDWTAFEESGSFIELSSKIASDNKYLKKVMSKKVNLIFPRNYEEFLIFVCNIRALFEICFYNKDYYEEVNYLYDSLTNGYHLNMSTDEVELYCFQVCNLVLKHMGW